MPEMEGIEFLEKAKEIYPEAKLVLLTAYSDTDSSNKSDQRCKARLLFTEAVESAEEKLYPVINDQLDEWQTFYKPDHEGHKNNRLSMVAQITSF
jgi:thioredoxin reductase (NADPH)